MGTSDAYSGGGGVHGKRLRDELNDWLDGLPASPPEPDGEADRPVIPADVLRHVIPMLRPSSGGTSDGPGGGGGGAQGGTTTSGSTGGAQRSARASASSAGRAAAAAYALRTGDTAALERLGLSFDELSSNPDLMAVAHEILTACEGAISDGSMEDEERRYVSVEVAQWVLEENAGGDPPTPEDIVRQSIAVIISEAAQAEGVEMIRRGEKAPWTREVERQLREAAEVLAEQVVISPAGMTDTELTSAIESGIETLRSMVRMRR